MPDYHTEEHDVSASMPPIHVGGSLYFGQLSDLTPGNLWSLVMEGFGDVVLLCDAKNVRFEATKQNNNSTCMAKALRLQVSTC